MSYEQLWGVFTVWLLSQVGWRWWGRWGYVLWFLMLSSVAFPFLYPAVGERAFSVAITWAAAVVLARASMSKALAFTAWCDHIRNEEPSRIAALLPARYAAHLRAFDTVELALSITVMVTLIDMYN